MTSTAWSRFAGIIVVASAFIVASCATTPAETVVQADLSALVQPYAARLLAAGISRIETPGADGALRVRVETPYGFFDIRYRDGLAPAPLVVIAGDGTAFVRANSYTPAQLPQYKAAIEWAVPEVLRVAPNNMASMRALQQGSERGGR
jgi:hypothetical protein